MWGWLLTKAQAHLPACQDAPTRQLRNSDSPKKLGTRFHFGARAANSCGSRILGVTRESLCERVVRGWIPEISCKNVRFVRFTPPPPMITIRNETLFRVDGGWRCWLCLTDAQRYYTTLQLWQVTGSADGEYPGYLARFSPDLVSYAGRGRDARDPRGICNNLGCTLTYTKSGCTISRDAPWERLRRDALRSSNPAFAGNVRSARQYRRRVMNNLLLPC